jgi:hypothetical protein
MNPFKKKPQDVPIGLKSLVERLGDEKAQTKPNDKEVLDHIDKAYGIMKDGTALEKKFGRWLSGKN